MNIMNIMFAYLDFDTYTTHNIIYIYILNIYIYMCVCVTYLQYIYIYNIM